MRSCIEDVALTFICRQSRPIVTREGIVTGVLAGQLDSIEDANGTMQRVCEELLGVLHFDPNDENRRGAHKSCFSGISLGGGQPVSGFVLPGSACTDDGLSTL